MVLHHHYMLESAAEVEPLDEAIGPSVGYCWAIGEHVQYHQGTSKFEYLAPGGLAFPLAQHAVEWRSLPTRVWSHFPILQFFRYRLAASRKLSHYLSPYSLSSSPSSSIIRLYNTVQYTPNTERPSGRASTAGST